MARRRKPLAWQAFHLPKRGHTAEEYEDAFLANVQTRRFALADGASESSFAALWARLLVEGFVDPKSRVDAGTGWLEPLQRRWAEAVDALALPWYAEAKREQGAFATFLGLQLQRRGLDHGTWRCLAVGDSSLFQIRADELLAVFPLTRSDEFDNLPSMLGSRTAPEALRQRQRKRQGRWQAGDRFLLMTDALAQWFLRQSELERRPWKEMEGFFGGFSQVARESAAEAAFASWIEELRRRKDLRNDDVTLIDIRL